MTIHVSDCAAQEREKYAEIWSTIPDYRNYSPGLENVERFMSVIKPKPLDSLIDVGCGTGCAGLEFEKRGLRVTYVDITDAGLDPSVNRSNFIQSPLWNWQWVKDKNSFSFCCDVLEHIPTEYTMLAVDRILQSCETAWLQICLVPDEFGKKIGEPLHLTVRPFSWWLVRLATLGNVIEARDLCGNALYVVRR